MTAAARDGSVGCAKVAGYGCVGVMLLGVIVGVGVWASWDLLRESGLGRDVRATVDTVKAEAAAIQTVREALLERYPAADVLPNVQIRSTNGVTVHTLELTLVDPRFDLPATDDERLAQAREIARAAVAAHPGAHHYDVLRVVVRRSLGSGAATNTTSYEFTVRDL